MSETEVAAEQRAFVGRIEAAAAVCDDVSGALELVIEELKGLLGADGVAVDLARGTELTSCYVTDGWTTELGRVHPVEGSLSGSCLLMGKMLRSANVGRDPRWSYPVPDDETVSMIAVPIYVSGEAVGVLRAVSHAESFFDDEAVAVAVSLTGVLAQTLARAVREEMQDSEGSTGLLHGVGVASDYEKRCTAQQNHAARYGSEATVLQCQIKGYVTSEILHELNKLIRKTDECFQLDAAVFAILMPGTTVQEAEVAAGRIKSSIERLGEGAGGVAVEWEASTLLPEVEKIA